MRTRLAVMIAGVIALALGSPGHAKPTPVLDGKKVKSIAWETPVAAQQHVVATSFSASKCPAEECDFRAFKYKPARGVAPGPIAVTIKWASNTTTDLDLFVLNSDGREIASCGAGVGTGERVLVPVSKLESGQVYTVVTHYYMVTQADTLKGMIEFPTTYTPSDVPQINSAHLECGRDGSA